MGTKFFLFDCETTGLSEQDHTLLTIFGLALNANLDIIDSIDLKIRPENGIYHVDPEAMAINKIDLIEHDRDAVSEKQAKEEFINFCLKIKPSWEPIIPIGKNVGFDIKFLQKLLGKNRYSTYFSCKILDISSIAHFQKLCNILPSDLDDSLSGLAEYFGFSTKDLHNAEFDAKLTLEVLKQLIQNNNMKGK
jgi:DNA polymerase III alpha subunit (gram-positive type)